MLRFKVGSIPVEVHVSHLLVSLFIAWSFGKAPTAPGFWPGTILTNDQHPKYQVTLAFCVVLWMLMVSFSVLVHELGHATTARAMGYPSSIQLIGLGGLTRAGAGAMPWHRDVLFTLAGPAAGLGLAIVSGVSRLVLNRFGVLPDPLRYVLDGLLYANVVWTVLNLVPLASLDGGRVASALLTRVFGRPGFLAAQVLSLGIGAAAIVWAVTRGQQVMALLLVMLILRTFANISAYQRGELPIGESAHPAQAILERAEQAFAEGLLDNAASLARQLTDTEVPVGLRSRAHHLLGWVALKHGRGREALDHFSQVQGITVPPHALAAAFSLIGDEARAIPLWEQAVRQLPDDTIRHEYAGALIRGGREGEARRLPDIRLALAYLAAERVHHLRQEYDKAAQMAEAAFQAEPSATLAYDGACAWALANQPDAALRLLTLATQNGFDDRAHAESDPDLASLRALPAFVAWLNTLPDTPVTQQTAPS